MRNIFIAFTIIAAPFFIYGSCNKDKQSNNNCNDVMCTMMFAMITAEVKDVNSAPVAPDEVFTIKNGTTDTLRFQQQMQEGHYVVMDDSYVKELQNKQATFHFIGRKAGKEIFNESYTISADCCHINKEAGNAVITIK